MTLFRGFKKAVDENNRKNRARSNFRSHMINRTTPLKLLPNHLNPMDTERYGDGVDASRLNWQGGGSVGKPVVPIYKHQHLFDPAIGEFQRGMDDRNKAQCHRRRLQRDAENVSLILDRPLQ